MKRNTYLGTNKHNKIILIYISIELCLQIILILLCTKTKTHKKNVNL